MGLSTRILLLIASVVGLAATLRALWQYVSGGVRNATMTETALLAISWSAWAVFALAWQAAVNANMFN